MEGNFYVCAVYNYDTDGLHLAFFSWQAKKEEVGTSLLIDDRNLLFPGLRIW